ncbi:MAG: glycoside hydrolase domain-containing protein, partial [Microcystis panniformis]
MSFPGSTWEQESRGAFYGDNGANNAISVGFPGKVNVWLDLEGISSEVSAEAVIQYCTNWYNAIAGAGYLPGLYVG